MNPSQTLTSVIRALKLHVRETGFTKTVIGLSGGIDSALVCAIAVQALGKKNVLGILMPGKLTALESTTDAKLLAKNLGIQIQTHSIQKLYTSYEHELDFLNLSKPGLAEENLQARIRANILMSLSNKYHYLVLNTGNKSEALTGYFTLYGDSIGGVCVLADLYKTHVYEVALAFNKKYKEAIPWNIFIKAPTAELRAGQTDEEDLLPYVTLDAILDLYFDRKRTVKQIVKLGFSQKDVDKVVALVKKSEFKRKQLPPRLDW